MIFVDGDFADRNCTQHYRSRIHSLPTAAREVLPLRELILELKSIFNIPKAELNIKCTIFEDNRGAEELAKVPKNRPRTKHIALKYHHF